MKPIIEKKPRTITYEKSASDLIWQMFKDVVVDKTCPYCGRKLNKRNFSMVFHYKGEPRFMHNSICCLSDYMREDVL